MRPYLAVIRDSFHAALSSRVLWIAFVAIWLVLGALCPIGYREDFTTTFRWHDFDNGTRFKAMLAQGLVDPSMKESAIGRVAAAMPEELRRKLQLVGEGDEVRIRLDTLSGALNECLDDESWYDAAAWQSTLRFRELRELDEKPESEVQADPSLRRRRARLRIEAAFPGVFETRASRSILVTYLGFDFPWDDIAVDKTQFVNIINHIVMPLIIDLVLGLGVLTVGILVTASIIPDMLQPGSLHLLLSKPISRTMLLLSKFLGGCAFMFLCVVQLVLGLYLIAGLRLDIWNVRMLWCIPVTVFLFAVYYSVSLVAGLRWRTPILAIGVTAIFWVLCFVVGLIDGLFEELVNRPSQIRSFAVAGDVMFGGTREGGLVRFDRGKNEWVELIEGERANTVIPPIVLDEDTIATARVRNGRFNPFGSGAVDLLVLNAENDWTPEPSLRLPTATTRLYGAGENSVLALNTAELAITSRQEIMEAAGESEQETEEASDEDTEAGNADWLTKLKNMMGGATSGFTSILPDRTAITSPRRIVVDRGGQWLVALSRGRLQRMQRDASDARGNWSITAEHVLDGDPSRRCELGLDDAVVLVARTEEPLQLFDRETFEPLGEVEFPKSLVPLAAVGLGGDRFALLASDGRCRIVERAGTESNFSMSDPLATREVESVHVDRNHSRIYLAHHVDQLDVLDSSTLEVKQQIRPSLARWRLVDRYVVTPLRTLVPRTGELGETTRSMVSGQSAFTFNQGAEDDEVIRYKIVGPVISCAVFIVVMMTVGCLYFATRDF